MKLIKLALGYLAHLVYELVGENLMKEPPADLVLDEFRSPSTGETMQLVRVAARTGGFYRVVSKPTGEGVRPYVGRRLGFNAAFESFGRLQQTLHR